MADATKSVKNVPGRNPSTTKRRQKPRSRCGYTARARRKIKRFIFNGRIPRSGVRSGGKLFGGRGAMTSAPHHPRAVSSHRQLRARQPVEADPLFGGAQHQFPMHFWRNANPEFAAVTPFFRMSAMASTTVCRIPAKAASCVAASHDSEGNSAQSPTNSSSSGDHVIR